VAVAVTVTVTTMLAERRLVGREILLLEAAKVLTGASSVRGPSSRCWLVALSGGTSGYKGNVVLSLRFAHNDHVGQLLVDSPLDGRIGRRQQNADLDTQHTLTQENVAHSAVHKIGGRLTSPQHITITELLGCKKFSKLSLKAWQRKYYYLHALGTLSTQFTRYHHLATLSLVFHDKSQDTIAGPANSKTAKKFVLQVFGLSNGAQSTIFYTLSVELHSARREVESLLDNRCEFANATSLVAEHVLGTSRSDDDLSASRSDTHFNSRVALLCEFASQKLVQFGEEDTIRDKLEVKESVSTGFGNTL